MSTYQSWWYWYHSASRYILLGRIGCPVCIVISCPTQREAVVQSIAGGIGVLILQSFVFFAFNCRSYPITIIVIVIATAIVFHIQSWVTVAAKKRQRQWNEELRQMYVTVSRRMVDSGDVS